MGQVWPRHDQETGLNYNYFRDYDPTTGRYWESDPIGLSGGINTYGYTGGNPITYSDPEGTDYWIEGSVEGEGGHPFHQSICVGRRGGKAYCISFGVTESCGFPMGCDGEVYEDDSARGPLVDDTHRLTDSATDEKIRSLFKSLVGKKSSYWLIGNNCRDFVREAWQDVDKKMHGLKGPTRGDSSGPPRRRH